MIRPLPLFSVREWGTRYQAQQVCPSCEEGSLQAAPICPSCMSTTASFVGTEHTEGGDVVSVYACDACSKQHPVSGRTRLECNRCGSSYEEGWHRHHYAEDQPTFLRGRVRVEKELYATVQHYLGRPDEEDPYHLADFVIDIDRDGDLPAAVETALAYAHYLDQQGAYYRLYFSGGKGFHLQVPAQVIGALPHGQLNSWHYKKLAQELQKQVGHELDMAIYTRRRMLRVEGSMHGTTGLYKVGLSYEELKTRRVAALDRAKHPPSAHWKSGSGIVQTIQPAAPLRELYQQALRTSREVPASSHEKVAAGIGAFGSDRHVACVQTALEDGPPGPGTRHKLTFNLAAYWTSNGLEPDDFLTWARDTPGVSDTPVSQRMHEASGALRWSQRNRPPFRCQTMQEMNMCDPTCPFYTGRI